MSASVLATLPVALARHNKKLKHVPSLATESPIDAQCPARCKGPGQPPRLELVQRVDQSWLAERWAKPAWLLARCRVHPPCQQSSSRSPRRMLRILRPGTRPSHAGSRNAMPHIRLAIWWQRVDQCSMRPCQFASMPHDWNRCRIHASSGRC